MRLKKYLRRILIITPLVCLIWKLSPIYFLNVNLGDIITWSLFILYLICLQIFLNIVAFYKENKKIMRDKITAAIFNIIFGSISFVIIFIVWFGSSMCNKNDIILYKALGNIDIKIVKSSFSCGAFDSDPENIKVQKVTPIMNIFELRTDIDTNKIVKTEWIKL